MPMRLSGLNSGLDTEAIVAELMSAQSLKKNKVVQAKTKLEWKQTAWSDLNKKLTSLYNGSVSKMRLSSSYNLKKAKVSDESKATVSADTNAVTGNYTMEVKEIASAQFLTSGKTAVTSTSQKLSELDSDMVGKTITVKGPSGEKSLTIDSDTKVSDFISTLKSAGLNASYDTSQKKFFISSKDTGAANAFSISASEPTAEETTQLNNLKSTIASAAGFDSYDELYASLDDDKKQTLDNQFTQIRNAGSDAELISTKGLAIANTIGVVSDNEKVAQIQSAVDSYAAVTDRESSSNALSALGLGNVSYEEQADGTLKYTTSGGPADMALVGAKDSKILLNGAELTSSSSTVSANGLNISLVSKTAEGESVTFSVTNDIDAVYDNIKKALKEYNDVMKEMNTLYNAESSKGYEPLTSEEKKALSDDEVEEWEKKIKDSLLRRDSTLAGITSSMRNAMMSTTTVNGKSYSLSSFGIMTSTNYQEGGLLHIYGDEDDDVYSGEADKLKKALTENPEDTIAALSDIFEKLRSTMFNKMSATEYSSGLTFYNDKQMDTELKDYKTQIKTWEDKLADLEDSYYKKFTAMETALAKLQSQTSSITGLLGG